MGGSMIAVTFECGIRSEYSDQMQISPRCSHCGTTKIASVRTSRPPRFTGVASGPLCEYKPLEPGVVDVAPAGPLRIKEQ